MNARTRKLAVVVLLSAMVAAAAAVTWSLLPRAPDATPVARKADRDAPLARKGDYLIPRVKPPPDLAARRVPTVPAVIVGGRLPNEDMPSIKGPPPPPSDQPSFPTSAPARAEATPQDRARARDRDVCAAHGMRREDTYQNNRWHSWRCVR